MLRQRKPTPDSIPKVRVHAGCVTTMMNVMGGLTLFLYIHSIPKPVMMR